jgi:hypothetical protein
MPKEPYDPNKHSELLSLLHLVGRTWCKDYAFLNPQQFEQLINNLRCEVELSKQTNILCQKNRDQEPQERPGHERDEEYLGPCGPVVFYGMRGGERIMRSTNSCDWEWLEWTCMEPS